MVWLPDCEKKFVDMVVRFDMVICERGGQTDRDRMAVIDNNLRKTSKPPVIRP